MTVLAASTSGDSEKWGITPWPVLILVGSEDDCIGPEMYRGPQNAFPHPDSPQEVLPDAGHFLHLERSAAFNRWVLDFLG